MRRLTELQLEHLRCLRDNDDVCLTDEVRGWMLDRRVLTALVRKGMVKFDEDVYFLTDTGRAAVEAKHA